MSVAVLYYIVTAEKINSALSSGLLAQWMAELPENKRQQLLRLKHEKDRYLSLAGLQLVKKAMQCQLGEEISLASLQFPEKAKPCLPAKADFNISHSGDLVCCVVSDTQKVGIDVEQQRKVSAALMKKFRADSATELSIEQFLHDWTRLEAIVKAADNGSVFNLKQIRLGDNGGTYQEHFWYCYPVELAAEYTCHIACSSPPGEIKIKYVEKL